MFRWVWVPCAVLLSSCSATSSSPPSSSASSSSSSTARPIVTTTTEAPRPPLNLDPSITPAEQLDPQDVCKVPDITHESELGGSGFPLSPLAGDTTRDLRVHIVPISAADSPFTEDDQRQVELAAKQATDYFSLQTYGVATLDITYDDLGVQFPKTVDEEGWIANKPQFERRFMVKEALDLMGERIPANADVLAFFAPNDERFDFGNATSQIFNRDGVPDRFVLLGGRATASWAVLAHEIIHVWIGSEDLYPFEQGTSLFMGGWDIMAGGDDNLEINSWLRWIGRWINDDQVRCLSAPRESVHFIEGLAFPTRGPKMVVVKLNDNAVMVIDSRRTTKWGIDSWDNDAPAALVYVVDTSIHHGQGPLRLRGTLIDVGDEVVSDGVRVTLQATDSTGDVIRVEPVA